ncbi:MAG TPA: hypothetical protein DCP40_14535 [Stenotrophomonas sp.]|nr:hypothetical protein [Stenotrophomonas sp.]
MTELTFRMLVLLTLIATVGGIVFDEIGASTLPKLLQEERLRIKHRVVAYSKAHPTCGLLRILLVTGYLASLIPIAFFVPFAPWLFLAFTVGWSALTVIDAPHVISRPASLFYEASLVLNGVILALCFFSSLSGRFSSGFAG